MRTRTLIPALLLCLWVIPSQAFPPAPYYRIFGTVRDEGGRPLSSGEGSVVLSSFSYSALGSASLSGGTITGVTIKNGGSGFTSAPSVTFSGGLGSGATGSAILSNGVVIGVDVTSPGSGYTAPVTVDISGGGGLPLEIVRSITDSSIATAINYSLSVPMDSGTTTELYDVTAMRPWLPFTIRVVINGVNYVPMQIAGATDPFWVEQIEAVNSGGINSDGSHWAIGEPSEKLRLDLTLGIDGDGDGMPDSWEAVIVDELGLGSIEEVNPDGDSDGDGVSNYFEYVAGTYAFDKRDRFELNIIDVTQAALGNPSVDHNIAHLQFLSIPGRTYRILEWTGGGEPLAIDFALDASAEDLIPALLATDVAYQDVYIPHSDGKVHLFILSVE